MSGNAPNNLIVTATVKGGKPPYRYIWAGKPEQNSVSQTSTENYLAVTNTSGYYPVNIGVSDSSSLPQSIPSYTINVPYAVTADYSASASGALTHTGNQTSTATVTSRGMNGFSGTVSFNWFNQTDWPLGLTATLPVAQQLNASVTTASSAVTIKTADYTPGGTYWLILHSSSSPVTPSAHPDIIISVTVNKSTDFFVSAVPASQTIGQGDTAKSTISLNGGYTGSVSLSVSGLPANTTPVLSPSTLGGSGVTTLTLTTLPSAPIGTYQITIKALGQWTYHTTTFFLTIKAPAPATMNEPSSGPLLFDSSTNYSATFKWSNGYGVTQFQLSLASALGNADYVISNSGQEISKSVPLPGLGPLTVTLSSLIAGTWQTLPYSYQVVQPLEQPVNGKVKRAIAPGTPLPADYSLPNDSFIHGLGPWIAYASSITGGVVVDTPYPRSAVTNCGITGPFAKSATVVPSQRYSGDLNYAVFDLSLILFSTVLPGNYSVSCVLNNDINHPVVADQQISVYDATPAIDAVFQDEPDIQGQPFYAEIWGRNFGPMPGALTVCVSAPSEDTPCDQAPEIVKVCLPLANGGTNTDCPEAVWERYLTSNQMHIKALITPADPNHVATYDVAVTSIGANGQNFVPGQRSGDASPSNNKSKRKGTIGTGVLPVKIFVIHGLGDTHFSMDSLAGNLRSNLNADRIVDSGFDYQAFIQSDCRVIESIAASLSLYVNSNTAPRQRVAFVAHSMGGLVVRAMLADGLLGGRVKVVGMATLGTPHLGYPYLPDDTLLQNINLFPNMCANQILEMNSNLLIGDYFLTDTLSSFLSQYQSRFNLRDVNGNWFAAAGRACDTPTRTSWISLPVKRNGCRPLNVYSDGTVCHDSAALSYPGTSLAPSQIWGDELKQFQHYSQMGALFFYTLCPTQNKNSIHDPPPGNDLFDQLRGFLNDKL